jgi:hypothetical protein
MHEFKEKLEFPADIMLTGWLVVTMYKFKSLLFYHMFEIISSDFNLPTMSSTFDSSLVLIGR